MTPIDSLRADARALGFDGCRILRAAEAPDLHERLGAWLETGSAGDMSWMRETADRRAHPLALWPEARSILMLAMNYGPDTDPLANLSKRGHANISVYARNRDYHDVVKGKLKMLASRLVMRFGGEVKVFVDTAPVMEKPLAARAGLGWQGKHTNLVSREFGSWLFIGSIFSTADLPDDKPETDHCGRCSACIESCPTGAIVGPYKLDARRCISYLTIEHSGPIPLEFRTALGNRVYGCDDCLAVCPWNKFAAVSREAKLRPRADLEAPLLADFLAMDEPKFRAFFAGGPVKRIGYARFLRNVLIATGNSGDLELVPLVEARLTDNSSLARGAAVWAISQMASPERFVSLLERYQPVETDPHVLDEWRIARRATIEAGA